MYVAGTGVGNIPTLYSVGFNDSGVMNLTTDASAPHQRSRTASQ
jgi:hypothetical protein